LPKGKRENEKNENTKRIILELSALGYVLKRTAKGTEVNLHINV